MLDSSGSIKEYNWDTTVSTIANDWISGVIQPMYGPFGNHVAARWFSTYTERFIGFQDSRYLSEDQISRYSEYVAQLIRDQAYVRGYTNTAEALTEIYQSDLPTSRMLGKDQTIVLLFTDGKSDDYFKTVSAAETLEQDATIFAIGIGEDINSTELNKVGF